MTKIDKHHWPKALDFNQGNFLLVDKPQNWTSFQVVKFVRENYPGYVKKVGHAGTLDPVATGLLILCTGKMTKSIEDFQKLPKTYEATFRLGATTPSFDADTEIDQEFALEHLDEDSVKEAASCFEGSLAQTPPDYSAVKVGGKRAYEEARKGKKVKTQSKPVEVYELSIEHIDWPDVHIRLHCSKGTYVRSLARDFGNYLRSGAYVTALRRTEIGDYRVEKAFNLTELKQLFEQTKSNTLS